MNPYRTKDDHKQVMPKVQFRSSFNLSITTEVLHLRKTSLSSKVSLVHSHFTLLFLVTMLGITNYISIILQF